MSFSKQNVRLADVGVMEDDTDLHWACFDGDEELVAAFLEEGADINCCSAVDGGTPLMRAAEGGHLGCTFMCVQAGACVNTEDRTGRTALHFAWGAESGRSQEEKVGLEEFLIQAGARGCRTGCCEKCRLKQKLLSRRAKRQASSAARAGSTDGQKRPSRPTSASSSRHAVHIENGYPKAEPAEVANKRTRRGGKGRKKRSKAGSDWPDDVLKVFDEEFGEFPTINSVGNLIRQFKAEVEKANKESSDRENAGTSAASPAAPAAAASCGGGGARHGGGLGCRRSLKELPSSSFNNSLRAGRQPAC